MDPRLRPLGPVPEPTPRRFFELDREALPEPERRDRVYARAPRSDEGELFRTCLCIVVLI